MSELGAQIFIQESLLKELASKESELARQRELYEQKLVQMTREKEQINADFNKIKGKLDGLGDGNGSADKKLKAKYTKEMKALEKRLKQMGDDAKRRDRELQDSVRHMDQISKLKESLTEAKSERKKLMADARAEAKEQRQAEMQRNKKMMQLKKKADKASAVNKVLDADLQQKTALLDKLKRENASVKGKLKQSDAKANPNAAAAAARSPPSVTRRSTRIASKRKGRRSERMSMKIAKKDIKFFRNEIDQAVDYRTVSRETDELIQRREALGKDRKRLQRALNKVSGAAAEELSEELETVQSETYILTEELQTRQDTLLEMQSSGISGYTDPTDVSDKCADFVAALDTTEARQLVKEFILMAVAHRLDIVQSKQAASELALQVKSKDALLKSYLSGGRSLSDSQPLTGILSEIKAQRSAQKPPKKETPSTLRPITARGGSATKKEDMSKTVELKKSPLLSKKSSPEKKPTTAKAKAAKPVQDAYVDNHDTFARGLRGGRKQKQTKAAQEEIVPAPKAGGKPLLLTHTHTITGHDDEVTAVAYHDSTLYTGSKDKSIRIWDLSAGQMTACLPDHEYIVKQICHAGTSFYSASRNVLRIWDARTNDCTKTIKMKGDISDMMLSDDPNLMYLTTEKTLRIYDLRKNVQVASYHARSKLHQVHAIQGASVAMTSMNNITVLDNATDMASLEEVTPHKLSPPHYDKVLSMASAGSYLFSGSRDYSIKRWDQNVSNGEWTLGNSITSAHATYVSAMASLDDGQNLISGSVKGALKVWDIDTCKLIGEVSAHEASVNAIAAAGNQVFTASSDKTVKVWTYDGSRRNSKDGGSRPASKKGIKGVRSEPQGLAPASKNKGGGRRMTYNVGVDGEDALLGADELSRIADGEDDGDEDDGVSLDLNSTVRLDHATFDFAKLLEESGYREDDM